MIRRGSLEAWLDPALHPQILKFKWITTARSYCLRIRNTCVCARLSNPGDPPKLCGPGPQELGH